MGEEARFRLIFYGRGPMHAVNRTGYSTLEAAVEHGERMQKAYDEGSKWVPDATYGFEVVQVVTDSTRTDPDYKEG